MFAMRAAPAHGTGHATAAQHAAIVAIESEVCGSRSLQELFQRIAVSRCFRDHVWGKLPAVFDVPVAGLFTDADLARGVDWATSVGCSPNMTETAQAADGTWTYPKFDGRAEDVQQKLLSSTVVYTEAQLLYPQLARLVLDFQRIFGLPGNCNIYQTHPDRGQSSPAHTDHHDAFVVQTQGVKRWRVWGPPPRRPDTEPLMRGKSEEDTLDPDALGPPVVDVLLSAGQVIYVPLGCTHLVTTETGASTENSIHLTFSLDTHIFDLSYRRAHCLCLNLTQADVDSASFNDEQWSMLVEPLPLGFLDSTGGTAPERVIAAELRRRAAVVEPSRNAQELQALPAEAVAVELVRLHRSLMSTTDYTFSITAEAPPSTPVAAKKRQEHIQKLQMDLSRARRHAREQIAEAKKLASSWTFVAPGTRMSHNAQLAQAACVQSLPPPSPPAAPTQALPPQASLVPAAALVPASLPGVRGAAPMAVPELTSQQLVWFSAQRQLQQDTKPCAMWPPQYLRGASVAVASRGYSQLAPPFARAMTAASPVLISGS